MSPTARAASTFRDVIGNPLLGTPSDLAKASTEISAAGAYKILTLIIIVMIMIIIMAGLRPIAAEFLAATTPRCGRWVGWWLR